MTQQLLRFAPLLKRTIWGGRRLADVLGKPVGEGSDYAESWEVVDHGDDQSIVIDGPLRGVSLAELVRERPRWLFGERWSGTAFPLLLKYLDCNRVLSVQVHPDDAYGQTMDPPDLGKTEAWYIVASEPESLIYAGLRPGVGPRELSEAIESGRAEATLYAFHPQPGDCLFIPAGTVHALGAGLLVAEIQQSSDTTFRLFDWNRVDAEGKSRPLHVRQAMEVIDFDSGPVHPRQPKREPANHWETLVECDKFVLRSLRGGEERVECEGFSIITVPNGEAELRVGAERQMLTPGQSVLIPAATEGCSVSAGDAATVLEMHLP